MRRLLYCVAHPLAGRYANKEMNVKKLLLSIGLLLAVEPVFAGDDYWVTVDRLNRRTCPESSCGVVGQLFYREKVTVFERKSEWVRISKYYDASCRNGKSEYVDKGNPSCSVNNGIKDGKLSEWVSSKYISKKRPADPGKNATGIAKSVSSSDDYRIYKTAFITAAEKLIDSGRCTFEELKSQGGFYKSTTYKSKPIYFTYCGGFKKGNKIHLDASTGALF